MEMLKNALISGSLIACSYCGASVAETECADPKSGAAVAACLAQELRASDVNINGLYSELMANLLGRSSCLIYKYSTGVGIT